MLLTFDGELLLAFDARDGKPRWQLALERPLAAIVFASAGALPRVHGGSPWRSPSSGSDAIAVDRAGGIHAIDATAGKVLGSLAPVGAPVAVAAAPIAEAFAIALADRVLLWHEGVRHELAMRATALAFSRDGAVLAVGTAKGTLVNVTVATRFAGATIPVPGFVAAIAARRADEWAVATDEGVYHVAGDGVRRTQAGSVHEIACSTSGATLVLRRGDTGLVVCDWPATPLTRITTASSIEGIAFASPDSLAIALQHGEASVVDLTKRTHFPTAAQPGRKSARWPIWIEAEKDYVAARGGADGFRPRTHFGLGALLSLAMLVVCVSYLSSASRQSWVPPPPFFGPEQCKAECTRGRLAALRQACEEEPVLDCTVDAETAQAAFDIDGCDDAKAALQHLRNNLGARDDGGHATLTRQLAAAENGLRTGCNAPSFPGYREFSVVHLAGPELVETTDTSPFLGDDPRALAVTTDGTVFLATLVRGGRCAIRRKLPGEGWRNAVESADCRMATVWARAADDVYAALGTSLRHFDGKHWSDLAYTGEEIHAVTGRRDELFVLDVVGKLHRHAKDDWTVVGLGADTVVTELFGEDDHLWLEASGTGDLKASQLKLFHHGAQGWRAVDDALAASAEWAAPNNEVFTARPTALMHYKAGEWMARNPGSFVGALWGRTATDVYAGGYSGLIHFDGETWTQTSFSRRIRVITGNASDLYLIADKPR